MGAPRRPAACVSVIRSTADSWRRSTSPSGTGSPNTSTTTLCVTCSPSSGTTSATWRPSSASTAPPTAARRRRRRRRPLLLLLPPPPLPLQLSSPLVKTPQKTQIKPLPPLLPLHWTPAWRLTSVRRSTAPCSARLQASPSPPPLPPHLPPPLCSELLLLLCPSARGRRTTLDLQVQRRRRHGNILYWYLL